MSARSKRTEPALGSAPGAAAKGASADAGASDAAEEAGVEAAGERGPIKRGPLLVEEVLQRLRIAIVQGDWQLGEKISEARVAAHLGVSKTPVREALVQLKREGLVEIRPQAGTYVFTLAQGELNEICEMRWVLEAAAVRRAFEAGRRAELVGRLQAIYERMRQARAEGDVRRYLDLDGALHHEICAACGNAYVLRGYALIEGKVAALRTHLGTDKHHLEKSFAEHGRLVELIETGTLEQTLALLGSHIARKEGSYWEHLDQTPSGGILPPPDSLSTRR
jgi:DNA-binding GntR family transcriptional regulator